MIEKIVTHLGLQADCLARFRSREPSNESTFLAQRQRVYEGLRLAGLRE